MHVCVHVCLCNYGCLWMYVRVHQHVLLALQGAMAVHEARHAAIMSTRGIQYKDPWISDDFVVGCIMIMFLLLFCFGKQ